MSSAGGPQQRKKGAWAEKEKKKSFWGIKGSEEEKIEDKT